MLQRSTPLQIDVRVLAPRPHPRLVQAKAWTGMLEGTEGTEGPFEFHPKGERLLIPTEPLYVSSP